MLDLPVKGMAQKGKGIGLYKRGQPIDIACLLVMGNQGFMNRLRLLLNCAKKKVHYSKLLKQYALATSGGLVFSQSKWSRGYTVC